MARARRATPATRAATATGRLRAERDLHLPDGPRVCAERRRPGGAARAARSRGDRVPGHAEHAQGPGAGGVHDRDRRHARVAAPASARRERELARRPVPDRARRAGRARRRGDGQPVGTPEREARPQAPPDRRHGSRTSDWDPGTRHGAAGGRRRPVGRRSRSYLRAGRERDREHARRAGGRRSRRRSSTSRSGSRSRSRDRTSRGPHRRDVVARPRCRDGRCAPATSAVPRRGRLREAARGRRRRHARAAAGCRRTGR